MTPSLPAFALIRMLHAGLLLLFLLAAVFGLGAILAAHTQGLTDETTRALASFYDLDRPVLIRVIAFAKEMLQWNWGQSMVGGVPVTQTLMLALPVTLSYSVSSLLVILALAIPLALAASRAPGAPLDRGVRMVTVTIFCLPGFVLAALLFFPQDPLERLASFACFSATSFALSAWVLREAVVSEMASPPARAALALGFPVPQVWWEHAVRRGVMKLGRSSPMWFFSVVATNCVLIESVFGLKGLGNLGLASILSRDDPVLLALVFAWGLVMIVARLGLELAFGILDPTLRSRPTEIVE